MKKKFTTKSSVPAIIVAFLVTMLSSCDEIDSGLPDSLEGQWILKIEEVVNCPDPMDNERYDCTTECDGWEFTDLGTYFITDSNGTVGATYIYEILASNTVNLCKSGVCIPYLYSVSGSALILTKNSALVECIDKYTLEKI